MPYWDWNEGQLIDVKAYTNADFVELFFNGQSLGKQEINHNVLTDIKTLYIDDICVDENARGKHVGTALFDAVFAYAKENGFYNITLNVWSCNPGAIRFYEAMGLEPQKIGMEKIL